MRKITLLTLLLVATTIAGCKRSFVRDIERVPYAPDPAVKQVVISRFVLNVDTEYDHADEPESESNVFFDDSITYEDSESGLFDPSGDIRRALNVIEVVRRSAEVYREIEQVGQDIEQKRQEVEEEIATTEADVVNYEHLAALNPQQALLKQRYHDVYSVSSRKLAESLKVKIADKDLAKDYILFNNLDYPQSEIQSIMLPQNIDGALDINVAIEVGNVRTSRRNSVSTEQSDIYLSISVQFYNRNKQLLWSDSLTYKSDIPLSRTYIEDKATGIVTITREDKPNLKQLFNIGLNRLLFRLNSV